MTILIVDDDAHVVRSIQKNIDWKALDVDTVYTANSARQARSVLEVYDVDVLLSDIEMPQASGLDLLEWVRQKDLRVEAIFLTSYANFEYARRAISLESLEYFLKPVDYDKLTDGLRRALGKARANRQNHLNKAQSESWKKSRPEILSYFWKQVVDGHYRSDPAALLKFMQDNLLPYSSESRFIPMLIKPLDRNGALDEYIPTDLTHDLQSCVHGLFDEKNHLPSILILEGGCWVLLLEECPPTCSPVSLERLADELIRGIRARFCIDLFCGIGDCCFIYELYQSLHDIQEMLDDNVQCVNQVLFLHGYERREIPYDAELVNALKAHLDENNLPAFVRAAQSCLDELVKKRRVNTQILKLFRLDVTQMIYAYLHQAHIQTHEFFGSPDSERYYENAIASVEDMKAYVRRLASVSDQSTRREKSVVDLLLEYIDEHYQSEISRSDLAQAVYLNQDYVSRLFKKEVGQSISSYIISKRMAHARALLRDSRIPINEISTRVGYDSFAYFSKLFKKSEGVSPNEYRRKAQKQK